MELSPGNGWGLSTDVSPTKSGSTTKPSTAYGQIIHLNRNDDGRKPMERMASSSELKQPEADRSGASDSRTTRALEKTNASAVSTTAAGLVDLLWPEKMKRQSTGTDCRFLSTANQTNAAATTATAAAADQLDSATSSKLLETSKRPISRKKPLQRSKYRKPSKTKDVLDPLRTSRHFDETSSSSPALRMTSLAVTDDVGLWMMIAERAPLQQASADNVSAIGYKSAILLSEEVATVSAAVASVLIFWSLLGTAVCLVLRMRRRKRRRLKKRHSSVDDVAHIDMLDAMIRTELARGRARLNTSAAASQSSPAYVNVVPHHTPPAPLPPLAAGYQTTFDSVQLVNSSYRRDHQNCYEYFVTGTGSHQFMARDRHPPPTRSVYNSPNIERVACVRLSNARSFEVLQRTAARSRKMQQIHRSRSFNEKPAKTVLQLSQERPAQDSGRARVSGSPSNRDGAREAGYVSLRDGGGDGSMLAGQGNRQDLSWVPFLPIKTSLDERRTPEPHPTESTVLNYRRRLVQYPPYHVPHHSTTSPVPYGGSRPYQDRGPGHPCLGECRGGLGSGDIGLCTPGYPSHRYVGCPRPTLYTAGYCSGRRPVRFPKMGQSCLVGEMQRNASSSSNPSSCRKSGGLEAIEMLHFM